MGRELARLFRVGETSNGPARAASGLFRQGPRRTSDVPAVFENGAFFDVLIGRVQAARASVHLETFLWTDGVLGRRVADALINRARAGLKVRVLLDARGL